MPGKSHGRRSLVGCSPWGREESHTTERLHFHFSLSCIGEGNGSPLQCSCLESPRDGGAWWAAVYGVAQSRTRLKRLSSSSSSSKVGPEPAGEEFRSSGKGLDHVRTSIDQPGAGPNCPVWYMDHVGWDLDHSGWSLDQSGVTTRPSGVELRPGGGAWTSQAG